MLNDNEKQLCDDAIVAIASGDRHPLGTLYDLMARDIYVTALTITQNHADAEDVLQDTMLQILKYASSYRQASNPCAWILTIARHRALDIVRRRKVTVSLDELPLSDELTQESHSEVLALLDKLTKDERQLVVFRLYQEFSYNDISKIMHISTFAAQKRYQRVLRKLKKLITEKENDL